MPQVQSTANCHRLASVGAQLEKNKVQQVRANVMAWINDNPSIVARLWELMETEMIWELLSDFQGPSLRNRPSVMQRSCYSLRYTPQLK